MGSIVKGVASLFGGKKRRREQKQAGRALTGQLAQQDKFQWGNNWQDMAGVNYDTTQGQVGTLGAAGQAQGATLGDAQGYRSTGYDAVGYDAAQTDIGGLQRGAAAGLTNTMNNLQVSTAGAEMAAREADQALAASQDLAAQAGTGAGGATALAAQAAKSKAGISADIDKQVKQNEMMRAQGQSELQRAQLAQGNLASQFDLGQSQFNVGAANQAAQFGAQARNQANQFNATTQNQFQQQAAQMMNAMDQFNLSNQNAAFAAETSTKNNVIAQNAQTKNNWALQKAGGQTQYQSNQWDSLMGMVELWSADYQNAKEQWAENEGIIGLGAMEGWNPPQETWNMGGGTPQNVNPNHPSNNPGGGAGSDDGTEQYGSAPTMDYFSSGPTG